MGKGNNQKKMKKIEKAKKVKIELQIQKKLKIVSKDYETVKTKTLWENFDIKQTEKFITKAVKENSKQVSKPLCKCWKAKFSTQLSQKNKWQKTHEEKLVK